MTRSWEIAVSGAVVVGLVGGLALFGVQFCSDSSPETTAIAERFTQIAPRTTSVSEVVPLSPLIPDIPEKTAENPNQLWVLSDFCVSAGLFEPVSLPGPDVRPRYMLMEDNLQISDYAADAIGLTAEEKVAMQAVADGVWNAMEDLAARHTEEDPLRMDAEAGVYAYRMTIPKEEGMRVLSDFEHNVMAILKPEKAKKAMLSFGWSNYFGAFGQTEVLVQFKETEYEGTPIMAHYEERNPRDGRSLGSGSVGYEDFVKAHGRVFEIQQRSEP